MREVKAGKVEFRVEKAGIVHVPIGKASFGAEKLLENAHGARCGARARQAGGGQGQLPAERSRSRPRWARASRSIRSAAALDRGAA